MPAFPSLVVISTTGTPLPLSAPPHVMPPPLSQGRSDLPLPRLCFQEILRQGHGLGAALWPLFSDPALQLVRKDGQELLQDQQVHDLLLAASLRLQPPVAQLPQLPINPSADEGGHTIF
uniref:Uncharacterized protein n=1 Tax=Podarcis muralis TaxID=64176 RepID=A0A670HRP6_PODMU